MFFEVIKFLLEVASTLVGKPLPEFTLPPALPARPGLDSKLFANGKPHLLNIFASWCIPCAVEAPQLAVLAQQGVAIDGIAIRDRQADVQAFLARNTDARLLPSPGHLFPGNPDMREALPDNGPGEHDGFFYALLQKAAA